MKKLLGLIQKTKASLVGKQTLIVLLILSVGLLAKAQSATFDQLVGTWEFIELQDAAGDPQKEIPIKRGTVTGMEVVNRDSYVFAADSTYTANNRLVSSTGKWNMDSTSQILYNRMNVTPEEEAFDILKKYNQLILDSNGKYYLKPIKLRVLKYDGKRMRLSDREDYEVIYNRKQ